MFFMGKYVPEQIIEIKGKKVPVKRFPRWTSLRPGEAWVSLRRRGMHAMHYESLSIYDSYLRELLHGIDHQGNFDHPSKPETYEILAALTNIDILEIYRSTTHRFSNALMPIQAEPRMLLINGAKQHAFPLLMNYLPYVT